MSQSNFSSLNLSPSLLENLDVLGYREMTPIQQQCLPPVLSGSDVIAQGKTGSGKTAAFALGILSRLESSQFQVQALVLCPTRELADQVATEIRRLARLMQNIKVLLLTGGSPVRHQVVSLKGGAHIVVGTPGRVLDHLGRETLDLSSTRVLVLDEADRMLQMGFKDSIDQIVAGVPEKRQTLLFSATYPDEIDSLSQAVLNKPAKVVAEDSKLDIKQLFFEVTEGAERIKALQTLLLVNQAESVLVFCNTREQVRQLTKDLTTNGFAALALHGDLEQRARDETLIRFSNHSANVLVATDVAARGLDIEELNVVVNYQMAREAEVHTHRTGRTGRAGSSGVVWTFIDSSDDYRVRVLEEASGASVDVQPVPSNTREHKPMQPGMQTIVIEAGKKQKLRPGDVLGALTGKEGIAGAQVGKINMQPTRSYVAVAKGVAGDAVSKLSSGKLKGRRCRARLL